MTSTPNHNPGPAPNCNLNHADDLLQDYAMLMDGVTASDRLRARVLDAARVAEGNSEHAKPTGTATHPHTSAARTESTGTARSDATAAPTARRTPRPAAKRPTRRALAVAACLALALAVGGVALATPLTGLVAGSSSAGFSIEAYAGTSDTVLPASSGTMIVLDSNAQDTQSLPGSAEAYENEGYYTGSVFHIEGDDIMRIQANVSRGELYRVEKRQFSAESDPELAEAVTSWKPTKIGEDGPLARYDRVTHEALRGSADPEGTNDGKLRGDPTLVYEATLCQRLGETIDVAIDGADEAAGSYLFGLWTNDPYDAEADDVFRAATDTLDGAQLTVTVTFADGSQSTQVVDLHTADFKTNLTETSDGTGTAYEYEITSEIVDGAEAEALAAEGALVTHTIYGLVTETNSDPFPCGEASYPVLEKPLTQPLAIDGAEAGEASGDADTRPLTVEGHAISESDVYSLADAPSYAAWATPLNRSGGTATATVSVTDVERLDALPAGVATDDLFIVTAGDAEADGAGASDGAIDAAGGYRIEADGTLSDGFTYLLVTKTVTNTSDTTANVAVASGEAFGTLTATGDGAYATARVPEDTSIVWRSGHDGPSWDTHYYFQDLEAGQTVEVQVLYVVPDSIADSPDLALICDDKQPNLQGNHTLALRIESAA